MNILDFNEAHKARFYRRATVVRESPNEPGAFEVWIISSTILDDLVKSKRCTRDEATQIVLAEVDLGPVEDVALLAPACLESDIIGEYFFVCFDLADGRGIGRYVYTPEEHEKILPNIANAIRKVQAEVLAVHSRNPFTRWTR